MIKKEIRVIGIDDCPFDKFKDTHTLVIGTFFRGGSFMDGVMSDRVRVDGINSTVKIAGMINRSRFRSQARAILLDGLAVGGFNVIDVRRLFRLTGKPVIVVIRSMPDIERIKECLARLGMERKVRLIGNAGIPMRHRKIYFQSIGIDEPRAREILDLTCTRSFIPEPIRAAHLIGSGIAYGESRGRA